MTTVRVRIEQNRSGTGAMVILVTAVKRRRATLLIVDRVDDLLAPLMHEFTYSSMLFDIDEPEETNAKIFRSSETGTEQKIWLDGRSPIWQQVRHNHISAVAGQLDTALRDTAASKTSSVLKKGFDTMSMEELREVMINAPEWSEVAAQVRGHVSFVMHLMDAYDKLGIAQASDVEQCIVSGVDGDGRVVGEEKIRAKLSELLADTAVSSSAKVRTLCIYIVCQEKFGEDALHEFVDLIQPPLSPESVEPLRAMLKYVEENERKKPSKLDLKKRCKSGKGK